MLDGKTNIKKRIIALNMDANYLKKIHNIAKQCLSCGAYSSKNLEAQEMIMDKLNVPDWEKEINRRYWNVKKKMAHKLYKELDSLLNDIEKDVIKNAQTKRNADKRSNC